MQFPQIEIQHNIGNIISIPNQIEVRAATYLSDNTAIGATTMAVDNAIDFTSGSMMLLISTMGAEYAEILNSTAHTNQGFTTGAALLPHSRGDTIQQLLYDQIVIYKSATIGGSYSALATLTFQVKQQNTIYFDSIGLTTDFYKIQWKNSLTSAVSGFSDPVSFGSYPEDSVADIINPVLMAMGVSPNDPKINTAFCISAVEDARKYTKAKLYGVRHAWNQEFEYPIKLLAGTNFVTLPDTIDFKETDQSLLAARFLVANILTPFNLKYISKRTWNQVSFQITGSTMAIAANIGATTLTVQNNGDFSDGPGVAYVATTAYSQTIMQIRYTSINKTNNTLLGVTGVIRALPVGTQIWCQPTISQPIYYTVYDNKLVFDRIIPDSMQGENVYIDFYKKLEPVTALYQELPEPYREIYKWYLRYAIKYRKDISTPTTDPDLVKFEGLVTALFNNLYTGQDTVIVTS